MPICKDCHSKPPEERCLGINNQQFCTISTPEREWNIMQAIGPYHVPRITAFPVYDYGLWTDTRLGWQPAPIGVEKTLKKPTELIPIGTLIEFKNTLTSAHISHIPSTVFDKNISIDECSLTWSTLFKDYVHFSVESLNEEQNTSFTTETDFYYALIGTLDTTCVIPLFGREKNAFNIVHIMLSGLKTDSAHLVLYDYIASICLQYYTLVRKRILVVDTRTNRFSDANPPFQIMIFLEYDGTRGYKRGSNISKLKTKEGLLEYALNQTFVTFYYAVLVCIITSLHLSDPFYSSEDKVLDSAQKVMSNLWTYLSQARFREQTIKDYELEVYRAKPEAHKASEVGNKKHTSLIYFKPKQKLRTNTTNFANTSYRFVNHRGNQFANERKRVVSLYIHQYFNPLKPIFTLKSDYHAFCFSRPSHSLNLVVYAKSKQISELKHIFDKVVELQNAIVWQLDKFTRKTYADDLVKALRQQYDQALRQYTPAEVKANGLLVKRERVWSDIWTAETPAIERMRYSVFEPSGACSPVFHPRHACSPYKGIETHDIHAPIDSPAGISIHAMKWMIRTSPALAHVTPDTNNNRLNIPGVLTFDIDADDRRLAYDHERGMILFRNYAWKPPIGKDCYLLMSELYSFFASISVDTRLNSINMHRMYRILVFILLDEPKVIRLIWDIYCSSNNNNMHQVWRVLRASYYKHRHDIFDDMEDVKPKSTRISTFIETMRTDWDGSNYVNPTTDQMITLLSVSAITTVTCAKSFTFTFQEYTENVDAETSQDSPLDQCREAYASRTLIPPTVSLNYSTVIDQQGKYRLKPNTPAILHKTLSIVVLEEYLGRIRRYTSILFPADAMRYNGTLTWSKFCTPKPDPFPVLSRLVGDLYSQLATSRDLKEELYAIAEHEKKRKRLELTVEEEQEEPIINQSPAYNIGKMMFNLLNDYKTDTSRELYEVLREVYDPSKGRDDVNIARAMNDFISLARLDLYTYKAIHDDTLLHTAKQLAPYIANPQDLYKTILNTIANSLPLKLDVVGQTSLKGWINAAISPQLDNTSYTRRLKPFLRVANQGTITVSTQPLQLQNTTSTTSTLPPCFVSGRK
jgi:hypothetical protein